MAKKDPVKADIDNRFSHHPPTDVTGTQYDAVRVHLGRLAQKFAKNLPDSREKSLALTKLEEAMFWANAAIARHDVPAAAETPQPSGPTSTRRTPAKRTAKKTSARRVTRRRAEPPI